MPIAVTMPALSPTMEEGTLARWLKQEGDSVNPGDVIAEIETDKATMEVEAVDEGVLGRIVVPEGTEGVKVNATIAWLLEEGEDASALPAAGEEDAAAKPEAASTEPEPEPESPPPAPAAPAAEPAPAAPAAETPAGTGEGAGERIAASPLARRMAKQAGLDLAGIAGSSRPISRKPWRLAPRLPKLRPLRRKRLRRRLRRPPHGRSLLPRKPGRCRTATSAR